MADSPSEPKAKRQRMDEAGCFAVLENLKDLKVVVEERKNAKKTKELYGGDWIADDGTGYAADRRNSFEDEHEYSDDTTTKSSKDQNKSSDILADNLGELQAKPSDAACASNGTVEKPQITLAPAEIVSNHTRKFIATDASEYVNSFNTESFKKLNNKENSEETPKTTTFKGLEVKKFLTYLKGKENIKEKATPVATSSKQSFREIPSSSSCKLEIPDYDMDISCVQYDENEFNLEKISVSTSSVKNVETPTVKSLSTHPEGDVQKLFSNWGNFCEMDNFKEEFKSSSNSANATANGCVCANENLRFWYWDAWEDSLRRPGEVFLFGRTADGKSICVRVENIDRVIYLLPREYLLDPNSQEPTKEKVTVTDMYNEFYETISADLNLTKFRSRKATRNFAYHSIGIDVPQQCDYLEVHYDGKKPPPNVEAIYTSIAHIFGANTTSLERFLLNRKIKGPCWLNLKQFTVNSAHMSWCNVDVSLWDPKLLVLAEDPKPEPPPPLTLLTLNVRTVLNSITLNNEICMISMLVNTCFHIDKPAPNPPFNKHMCGLTCPATCTWPSDLNAQLAKFTATKVFKHDAETSLLSWLLAQYQQIDADLIVTHDASDCQLEVIADRIVSLKIPQGSRLARLPMTQAFGNQMLDFFIGRMICDVKRSAEECIISRSYDLQTLCQNVLKIKDTDRIDVNREDILEMYETADGILKLCTLTMQDASYILRLMCDLNLMLLALQITNICGNIMSRTLQSGRSGRIEYLLLHAFTEKKYIVPDKKKREFNTNVASSYVGDHDNPGYITSDAGGGCKKAAFAGGLVLDPIRGLYNKYILVMDFNSLYPSIIQEYNICFTTVKQPHYLDDLPTLPNASVEQGILPQQIRRLVESRKEVQKLMAIPDLSPELQMQYHIRQMALKLTANSMYGCLGFAHSRFFAQHLAALVTHKGRNILMNTKALLQKLNYEVIYGDTDSIMVNTNITDYDQVLQIGSEIKKSVNKLYKQLELDIDGVFSCLLLLKKKKYAAIKVIKTAKGELKKEQVHKGIDIVRRDWSQIAVMVGKLVLDEVLSDKHLDDKLDAVHAHLEKVKVQILAGEVPMPMFLITKKLSKSPAELNSTSTKPHVQVALRMNKTRNRRYKKGDMVDYVICQDGTLNRPTQRAYHLDELKGSETLKLDSDYYLSHQIHPVVTRMVTILDGTDASRVADCLGLDPTKCRVQVQRTYEEPAVNTVEKSIVKSIVKSNLQKYHQCEKFKFTCFECGAEIIVAAAFKPSKNNTHEAALQKCSNSECSIPPYQYIITIRNELILSMRSFITRFYQNWLICDDPACSVKTRCCTHVYNCAGPACMRCRNGNLVRQYTERDLYNQLSYFQYMFDLSKQQHKNFTISPEVTAAYNILYETIDQFLQKSAYCNIAMAKVFADMQPKCVETSNRKVIAP